MVKQLRSRVKKDSRNDMGEKDRLLATLDRMLDQPENKKLMESKESPLFRDIRIIDMYIANTKNKEKLAKLLKRREDMMRRYEAGER